MRSDLAQFHKGRLAAFAIVLFATLVIGLVVHRHGWQRGWQLFGVSTHNVAWLDLRVITAAAQTAAEGGNPYLANPHDPTGRAMNYPSLWLRIFPGELSPVTLAAVALGFALAAFGTSLLWMKSFGARAGAFVGLLLLSPSLLLAVERGNTDLAMFAVVGVSLLALDSRDRLPGYLGIFGLSLASVLKLYPAIALVFVAVAGPGTLRRVAQFALVIFAVWLGLHWSETTASLRNTQIGGVHSYGRTVLPFALELYARAHGQVLDRAPLDLLANVLAAVILAAMGWFGFKLAAKTQLPEPITHREVGFLTGASIYVLTFLAGSNFNYRLWFLLFTLPWLLPKAGQDHPAVRWARIALASFFVLAYASAVWWVPLVWVAQAASWVLFAALTVLLASCAISWLRRTSTQV